MTNGRKIINRHRESDKGFDKREKRLNILFKVLYVFAALWVALLYGYASSFMQNAVTQKDSALIVVGLIAGITVVNTNIIRYIFNELKCLKIGAVDKSEVEYTEKIFANLFNSIGCSVFALVSSIVASYNLLYSPYAKNIYPLAFILFFVVYIATITFDKPNKAYKFKQYEINLTIINTCVGSITYFLFFLMPILTK